MNTGKISSVTTLANALPLQQKQPGGGQQLRSMSVCQSKDLFEGGETLDPQRDASHGQSATSVLQPLNDNVLERFVNRSGAGVFTVMNVGFTGAILQSPHSSRADKTGVAILALAVEPLCLVADAAMLATWPVRELAKWFRGG